MKLLFLAGSLRKDSLNKKYVKVAMQLAQHRGGVEATYLDLKDFPMPVYDGDIETATGIPQSTKKLGELIRGCQGLVISTPEYNGSISSPLKNMIDWLSREKPLSLTGKHVLLLGASPGALGAIRGLWHSRQPFEAIGVHVYPTMMGLPSADTAFGTDGKLMDPVMEQRLTALVTKFLDLVQKTAS